MDRTTRQLEGGIQAGLLVLVALMPFHAFLSVWFGHLLGHEAVIQAWKEFLLLVLVAVAVALCWIDPPRLKRLKQPWIYFATAFAIIALLVTLATRPPLTATAFGIKTDLEFLVAAALAALVATPALIRRLTLVILAGAAIVITFGLAQIYLLPANFLTLFGYGPDTIVPYEHIIQGVSALRFPSTLGGPNQLGTYLILPLCLSLTVALRKRRWWLLALTAGGLIVLIGTYSRSAWIGAAAALAVTLFVEIPRRLRSRVAIGLGAVLILALALLPLAAGNPALRYFILHSDPTGQSVRSSDSDHAASLRSGLTADLRTPLGHGLGTAGPATFHAGTGNIIENYFLQIGYEAGLVGTLLFIALTVAIILRLANLGLTPLLAVPAAAAIAGISLAALVLPAWTDSSTALITWTAAGALTGIGHRREDV